MWCTRTNQERLRITVPNMTCNALAITPCGTCIISGKKYRSNYPTMVNGWPLIVQRFESAMMRRGCEFSVLLSLTESVCIDEVISMQFGSHSGREAIRQL